MMSGRPLPRLVAGAFSALVLLSSCGPTLEPTLSSIQAVIFDEGCTAGSCHGEVDPQAGLDLSTQAASYAGLVGVEAEDIADTVRVVPGDPDSSGLYMVLLGPIGESRQMPIGEELSEDEREAVRQWIADGAAEGRCCTAPSGAGSGH